jgi:hypothetical protein
MTIAHGAPGAAFKHETALRGYWADLEKAREALRG